MGESDGQPKDADWAAAITGVPADTIRALARRMAATRTMISASWSLQRADHGEQPYWAVILLAACARPDRPARRRLRFRLWLGRRHCRAAARLRAARRWRRWPTRSAARSRRRASPTACCIPASATTTTASRATYPDIRLVYWAGGNPFHHHQDTNQLRARLAAAGNHHRARAVVDRDRAPCRHRAAGDHHARAQRHRRLAPRPLRDRHAAGDRAGRRGAERLCDLQRTGAPARLRGRLYRKAATRWGGCAISTAAGATRSRTNQAAIPDFDGFWSDGYLGNPAARRRIRDVRRLPRRSREQEARHAVRPDRALFRERIAGFGYDDCPPHPTWLEPTEWLGGETAKSYPLHLISSQPRYRLHSQMDAGPVSARGKVAGREAIVDQSGRRRRRGIADGDVVRVYNEPRRLPRRRAC